MNRLFFLTAGLLLSLAAHADAELITDTNQKQGIYSRAFADLKTAPFVCASGAILEIGDDNSYRPITIGTKKDGQWTAGARVFLPTESYPTVLYVNQGEQPVITVMNYVRGYYLMDPAKSNGVVVDGDQVVTAFFTTTNDYRHITRVQLDYKAYKSVEIGNIIDSKTELREIRMDLVMDCSRP